MKHELTILDCGVCIENDEQGNLIYCTIDVPEEYEDSEQQYKVLAYLRDEGFING